MSDYKIIVDTYEDYSLKVEVGRLANNLEELKMKISNIKKENGNTEITFSDGHKINVKDGDTPTIDKNGFWIIGGQSTGVKARAELSFKELSPQEKLSIKGDKGDPLKWDDLTYEQKASLKGETGDTGQASRVVETKYDSDGNTLITFNDKSTVKINHGPKGERGYKGDSTTTSSITKSGLTTTVKFTDGKSMQIQDGKSVKVESYRILDNGDTEISFTDGEKAIVKKGQDGTVKFDDLTEEQQKSLQVDVVDDLTTGGSDKALSAEQGKVLAGNVKKLHDKLFPPIVMTAVIDQTNSNPLTCITYEDDAKMMEKGSPEWDEFFQSQLVLFKDGKEVRELEDSELNNLSPDDGDVMVRFPRKGLRIKTVGEKVYVSMTNKTDAPNFKYYAHSRGDSPRDAFYLGAYLGFEESGKLRSITGKVPTGDKTIGAFRTIAQVNGTGYEQLAFYQWTFLQAMYVLKYGNLDSQTALGEGNVLGSIKASTGETNGKGIDFGNGDNKTKVRFQWIEDFFGTKSVYCDGCNTAGGKIWTGTDKFNNSNNGYKSYETTELSWESIRKIHGDPERGFLGKMGSGSNSTYFCDKQTQEPNSSKITYVGGGVGYNKGAGVFCFDCSSFSSSSSTITARLMFL